MISGIASKLLGWYVVTSPQKKNHRPSNAGLFAGQVASTISTLSRVSRGVLGGPKKPTSRSRVQT